MSFGDALARFAVTEPKEVADSVERSKTKKPPQDGAPRRPTQKAPLLNKVKPKEPILPSGT